MQPIYSACPVVRTESVPLMRWLDADGLGGMEVVRFRREILWIRETEAHVLFLHGGTAGASDADRGIGAAAGGGAGAARAPPSAISLLWTLRRRSSAWPGVVYGLLANMLRSRSTAALTLALSSLALSSRSLP